MVFLSLFFHSKPSIPEFFLGDFCDSIYWHPQRQKWIFPVHLFIFKTRAPFGFEIAAAIVDSLVWELKQFFSKSLLMIVTYSYLLYVIQQSWVHFFGDKRHFFSIFRQ